MKALFLGVLIYVSCGIAPAQANLRQIDFKNFSYPWSEYSDWPDRLEWLDTTQQSHIQLVQGRWSMPEAAPDEDHHAPFSGLTLERVQFADVTGDGHMDAIVVLRFDTGGTQYSHYVCLYSLVAGKPKLLAFFHSGDRAFSGLYCVYGQAGRLVVELFDPDKRLGDCCSEAFIRTRYQWRDGKFQAVGPQESGTPKSPSRLPVTVFGTHQ